MVAQYFNSFIINAIKLNHFFPDKHGYVGRPSVNLGGLQFIFQKTVMTMIQFNRTRNC